MCDTRAETGIQATASRGGKATVLHAAGWLGLAAAPTFALMAGWTGVPGGGRMDMACPAAHGLWLPGSMALMYGLMSVFHLAPWLKRAARRRHGIRRRGCPGPATPAR